MKNILFMALVTINFCVSAQMTKELVQIQKQWAIANYQTSEEQQDEVFEKLTRLITQLVLNNPKNAHILVWEGIIYSSYASIKGGINSIKLAKYAVQSYQLAISIDDNVLNGLAYTSLGALYGQIPSWKIGFRSDEKALILLKKGLQLNPDGLDSNYFYAKFLCNKSYEYSQAKQYLQKAQQAPLRLTHMIADIGRKEEINSLMIKINKKLMD